VTNYITKFTTVLVRCCISKLTLTWWLQS